METLKAAAAAQGRASRPIRRAARSCARVVGLGAALAYVACSPPSSGRKRWDGPFVHVVAGDQETCAIDPSGAARCWGDSAKQPPPGAYRALDVSLWGCGVRTSGELACWGPAPTLPPPTGSFVAVAAGAEMCALSSVGSIVCWLVAEGRSCTAGPGGASICVPHRPPPHEPVSGGRFTKLVLGAAFGAGLQTTGQIRVWGGGQTADRRGRMVEPSRISPGPGPWTDLAAGADFLCGLATEGTVTCWSARPLPEMDPPASVTFTSIAARGHTACGVDDRGAVHCWGREIAWRGATFAPPLGAFDRVSVGRAHVCARGTDGSISCWGVDQQGQVTGKAPSLLFRN